MSPRALVVVCYGLASRKPLRMVALMTGRASLTGCCVYQQTGEYADDGGGSKRPPLRSGRTMTITRGACGRCAAAEFHAQPLRTKMRRCG